MHGLLYYRKECAQKLCVSAVHVKVGGCCGNFECCRGVLLGFYAIFNAMSMLLIVRGPMFTLTMECWSSFTGCVCSLVLSFSYTLPFTVPYVVILR